MTKCDPLVSALHDARQRFLELVAEVRPDLPSVDWPMVEPESDD